MSAGRRPIGRTDHAFPLGEGRTSRRQEIRDLNPDRTGTSIRSALVDRRLPWRPQDDDDVIVFHHGLGACAESWRGWAAALADRYRLLTFDMRGHGASPAPPGYRWTLEALTEDLEAVVDDAGLGRFHLVGESIGGTVALRFAARHPERVRTLTVSNGAHRGSGITNLEPWERLIGEGGMAAWSAHMMRQRFLDGAIGEDAWRWYETQQSTCDPAGVLALAAALAAADLTPELARVAMPVLLMHPDRSPFIPVALMVELREALPDARLHVVPRSRHGLPFSHAGECAAELARLLDEVSPGGVGPER